MAVERQKNGGLWGAVIIFSMVQPVLNTARQ